MLGATPRFDGMEERVTLCIRHHHSCVAVRYGFLKPIYARAWATTLAVDFVSMLGITSHQGTLRPMISYVYGRVIPLMIGTIPCLLHKR